MNFYRKLAMPDRIAWILWLAYFIYLAFFVTTTSQTLASADYYHAAQQWLSNQSIYDGHGWGFIYFPQSAVLYLPFGVEPFRISEVLWRFFLVGLLSASFWQLRSIAPFALRWFFLALTITCGLWVANGALKLGQMNVTVAALLFFTIVCIAKERWWWAALTLTLSLAFKPTSIIFWLLLVVLYQPLRLKMLVLFLLSLALPFLFANPDYVLSQYIACAHSFQVMAQTTSITGWADIFNMLYFLTGLSFTPKTMFIVRVTFAGLVLAFAYYSRRVYQQPWSIILICTIAAVYLLLFNPRTENNGYIVLMPMLVWFAFHYYGRNWLFIPLVVGIIAMSVNYGLCAALGLPNTWIRPLVACLFILQLIWVMTQNKIQQSNSSA